MLHRRSRAWRGEIASQLAAVLSVQLLVCESKANTVEASYYFPVLLLSMKKVKISDEILVVSCTEIWRMVHGGFRRANWTLK